MNPNPNPTAQKNGSQSAAEREARLSDIEQRLTIVTYLHAELTVNYQRVAAVVAAMLAQQMQPQVQAAILAQLNGQTQQPVMPPVPM